MYDQSTLARFFTKVNTNGTVPLIRPDLGPCHLWTAGTINGYGSFYVGGRMVKAHRFAYEVANGQLPDGLWALHHCDVRPCVNFLHLYAGDHSDNTRDMVGRGRAARGERSGQHTHPERRARGERVHTARLSAVQVIEIRHLYAGGAMNQPALAGRYGVDNSTISRIVNGHYWSHI
jgi:hypothetical protein